MKVGTYSELIEQNGAFAEYLRIHANQDQNEQGFCQTVNYRLEISLAVL